MARRPKDIWGIPFPSAQDVVGFMNKAVRDAQIASGDRQARPGTAEYALRDMGRGISATNDYLNPFANTTKQLLGMAAGNEGAREKFAKSLAGDVAITAAAGGVGVALGKGVKAVEKSGFPAKIGNMIKNEQVFVHGSPVQGIKTLRPSSPTHHLQEAPSVYGMRVTPRSLINPNRPEGTLSAVVDMTGGFAQGVENYGKPASGSLYVTKFNRKDLTLGQPKGSIIDSTLGYKNVDTIAINSSKAPTKIYSEILRAGKTKQQIESELKKAIKRAGGKVEPSVIDKLIMNNKAAKKLQDKKVADRFISDF